MSSFSIGKNEIKKLEEQEKRICSQLNDNSGVYTGNVLNFKDAILKKEQQKICNKISILKYMNPESDPEDDGIA